MIDYALFYNSQDNDRVYDADSFSDWLKKFFTTGVFEGDLQVQATEGMKITVGEGYANIEGKVMLWKKPTVLDVATANATFDRIDTVVVERNDSERNFFLKVITGGASSTPEPTAPVRGGGVYQLVLAEIHVKAGATAISQANITDKRANANVCGIVAGAVKQIDFSQIQAQYDAYMKDRRAQIDADYATYKEKVDKKEAESANALKKHLATLEANEGLQEQAFSTWFNSVKNQLSTDQAGHLQNQLDALKEKHDKDIDSVTKKLITLTVTTDDDELIGDSVKVTKGVTALEQTFDASKSLTFNLPELGTWKVTNTNPDHSGSSEVTCEMYGRYSVALSEDFIWKNWVKAGGLSADGYASFDDVLADEKAVRQLMTKHASADILAEAAIKNHLGVLKKITASKTAMKWIGLRDYICDKLLADVKTQSDLLASDHWRYILKDGVPYMTSDTAPYGTATNGGINRGNAYKAFINDINDGPDMGYGNDGNIANTWVQYKFVNPICVKRIRVKAPKHERYHTKTFKIQYSNDGSTFKDIESNKYAFTDKVREIEENVNNDCFALYWRVQATSTNSNTKGFFTNVQFYGRSLNVSIPIMSSNTSPWGKVIGTVSMYARYDLYKAFDGNPSDQDVGSTSNMAAMHMTSNTHIGYAFPQNIAVRRMAFSGRPKERAAQNVTKFVMQYSDDGTHWDDATQVMDNANASTGNEFTVDVPAAGAHRYWRCKINATRGADSVVINEMQFYGVDYSEREDRAYIYDHGVEVLPITTTGEKNSDAITLSAVSGAKANTDVTSAKRLRASVGRDASGSMRLVCGSAFKAITSTDMPANAYLDISSVNGSADVGIDMTSVGMFDVAEMWLE